MKKILFATLAALAMCTVATAQDSVRVQRDTQSQNVERMIKHRTEQTVQKYGLSEEQAAKLLDLNTRFAGKMRPMAGMRRANVAPGQPSEQRPNFNREELQKNAEAYNKELKSILTAEQYQAYEKDEQARRDQFRGSRGLRPHRNINDK